MVDRSAVGHCFAPVSARVEHGRLRYFLNTLGEQNLVYRDAEAARAAGFAGTPAPPTYLFCLEMLDADDPFEMFEVLDIDLARVLHGEQSFVYHAPVLLGDTLTFRPRVAGVTEKKGGALTLIVIACEVTNQDGVHVADVSRTIVVRNEVAA